MSITYAPPSLQFGKAAALRSSSVDDMLAVAMGYTPQVLIASIEYLCLLVILRGAY